MYNFQKRIHYRGDLKPFLKQVCQDFHIGEYGSCKIVPIGYEDFNLFLKTKRGRYFVKIFASFRNKNECSRYVEIMDSVLKAGISYPRLYKSNQDHLYEISNNSQTDRLCVMEFIDGQNFYQLQTTPTVKEMRFIIKQAALVNKIDIRPSLVYDQWAITNFPKEYKKKGQYLNKEDKNLIEPLVDVFNSLSVENLPHCFVHGDITKTNTMKSVNGDIYILDFAVANYYPRIQELAVILCDLFFNPKGFGSFPKNYDLALSEYQKYITLTADEIKKLSKEKIVKYFDGRVPGALKKYLLLFAAGFIIASPLPDEIGVSLMAASKIISLRVFSIISYLLNTSGIFLIMVIGNTI